MNPDDAHLVAAARVVALEREYLRLHPHVERREKSWRSPERLYVWARQRWNISSLVEVWQFVTVTDQDVDLARKRLLKEHDPRKFWSAAKKRAEMMHAL